MEQEGQALPEPPVHMKRLSVLCSKWAGNTQVDTLTHTLPRDVDRFWKNNRKASVCKLFL